MEGMTNQQYKLQLEMLLEIVKNCETVEEVIEKIKVLIDKMD